MLLEANNKLSSAITECTKRPCPNDCDTKSPIPLDRTVQPLIRALPSLLHSEYPFMRFWTRDEWKAYHTTTKDSLEVTSA